MCTSPPVQSGVYMDIISIMLGVAGFSLKSLFIKLSYLTGISPEMLMSWRMIFALPIFIIVYLIFRNRQFSTHTTKSLSLILLSAGLYYGSGILDIAGLEKVSVGLERILLFTIPMFVLLFSLLFQGKRYRTRVIIYVFLSWVGIIFSFNGLTVSTIKGNSLIEGALMILGSACFYAIYMILSASGVKHYGAIKFNALVMILSSMPAILPFILSTLSQEKVSINESQLLMPLYLAIFSTVLPSFLMMYGIKRCGPTLVSTMNNFGPFLTIGFGYYFLGEKITTNDLIGMVIVIINIALLSKEMSFKGVKNESSRYIGFRKKERDNSISVRKSA